MTNAFQKGMQDLGFVQSYTIYVLAFGVYKLIKYLSIFPSVAVFIRLIQQVLKELTAFTLFFSLFLIINSLMNMIMRVETEEVDDYFGISYFSKSMINSFRSALGDIIIPNYDQWLRFNRYYEMTPGTVAHRDDKFFQ